PGPVDGRPPARPEDPVGLRTDVVVRPGCSLVRRAEQAAEEGCEECSARVRANGKNISPGERDTGIGGDPGESVVARAMEPTADRRESGDDPARVGDDDRRTAV